MPKKYSEHTSYCTTYCEQRYSIRAADTTRVREEKWQWCEKCIFALGCKDTFSTHCGECNLRILPHRSESEPLIHLQNKNETKRKWMECVRVSQSVERTQQGIRHELHIPSNDDIILWKFHLRYSDRNNYNNKQLSKLLHFIRDRVLAILKRRRLEFKRHGQQRKEMK